MYITLIYTIIIYKKSYIRQYVHRNSLVTEKLTIQTNNIFKMLYNPQGILEALLLIFFEDAHTYHIIIMLISIVCFIS